MKIQRIFFLIILVAASMTLSCATMKNRNPLPQDLSSGALVLGSDRMRMWGDRPPAYAEDLLKLQPDELKDQFSALFNSAHNYLAISGGGANGAFGAGLLFGWTEKGDRPEFSIVTGVSTGALTAPFAFLGPGYDEQLKAVYTTTSTKDILKIRSKLKILTGDSAASSEALQKLLVKYINQDIMEAIASEHLKGRRLFIGTVNLDAARPVIWNIGEIAASGNPNALNLIRDVLLASASIPGVFPPVFLEVQSNGVTYDEMHVDGGTASQVFIYPTGVDLSEIIEKLEVEGTPRAYIIRNSRMEPEWKTVKPKLRPILSRTTDTLIMNQGYGDLYRIYLRNQQDGVDFNLAFIPDDFNMKAKEAFDPEYMGKLFDLGYQMGKQGYPWEKIPPGFFPVVDGLF
jgi:predicted patatin/cPLA2 family phospholipase